MRRFFMHPMVRRIGVASGKLALKAGKATGKFLLRTAKSGFKAGLSGKLPGIGLPKKKK